MSVYNRSSNFAGIIYRADLGFGIEVGAILRRKGGAYEDTWEAFATFGRDALNQPGFKNEQAALAAAEKWVRTKIENVLLNLNSLERPE